MCSLLNNCCPWKGHIWKLRKQRPDSFLKLLQFSWILYYAKHVWEREQDQSYLRHQQMSLDLELDMKHHWPKLPSVQFGWVDGTIFNTFLAGRSQLVEQLLAKAPCADTSLQWQLNGHEKMALPTESGHHLFMGVNFFLKTMPHDDLLSAAAAAATAKLHNLFAKKYVKFHSMSQQLANVHKCIYSYHWHHVPSVLWVNSECFWCLSLSETMTKPHSCYTGILLFLKQTVISS